ncbi:Crp/Fnr family transcriptional regulator [Bradyrhizobium liaoningense]|uniref:Crp/Fnr family transcriptional regulator n=1 Tax=Bradyrhizobium liaoningense TaxID=43992 RepID=UPI001BA549C9|nr:Crp/Fnr family transcriptional regulator [Bradyrhizobium liaoningense]MBR0714940.1 Crp/Fnr family transcriptional regulator [Bradyrhizobium liaoningense]
MTAPAPVDLEIAAEVPVFSGLKPQELAVLLAEASVFNLRPGHALFRQGEPAEAFFVILDGWIKLYRITPAGDEAVLNVLTRGESFAEAVTFTSGRYPATACAVTPARVMLIPANHVMNCVREMPDVAIAMIASTSQHLHRMVQQIEQLMAQSATQRVAEFLASLAPTARGPCTITLPYDKSLIAGRLGLKPESLSRVFAKLRSVGVDVRASTVVVRDMGLLCRLVACDRTKPRCPIKPKLMCREPPPARTARQEAKSVTA